MLILSVIGPYKASNFNALFKACDKHKATIRSVTSQFENDYFATYAIVDVVWAYVDKLEKELRSYKDLSITITSLMDHIPGDDPERPNVFDLEFSVGNRDTFNMAALIKLVVGKNNIIYEMSFMTKFLPIAGVEVMVGTMTVGVMGGLKKALDHLDEIGQLATDLDVITTYSLTTS